LVSRSFYFATRLALFCWALGADSRSGDAAPFHGGEHNRPHAGAICTRQRTDVTNSLTTVSDEDLVALARGHIATSLAMRCLGAIGN